MLLTLTFAFAQTAAPQYFFSHLAGPLGGSGNVDGIGAAARFYEPSGVAVDNAGNLYVADTSNHTIRKILPGGVVTTLAGWPGAIGSADGTGSAALLHGPGAVTIDSARNVYVADSGNNTIRKITALGAVTTLAGTAGVSGNADGTGAAAQFRSPVGVAVDGAGNVYVGDSGNCAIRQISPAGVVTTLAGGQFGSADGTGGAAQFALPGAVAVDGAGNVYVADERNYTIRKITPGGVVTTFAGKAGDLASAPGGGVPTGLTVDVAGNVYVTASGLLVSRITPGGVVTTLAGTLFVHGSADGTGAAAQFNGAGGLAADGAGNVYVADGDNHEIRKISPVGVVTTVAGLAGGFGSADGTGETARFCDPSSLGVDSAGNVYVADTANETIRKISAAGAVTTLAGTVGSSGVADGTGAAGQFSHPAGVAVDDAGTVYVADRYNTMIRKITPGGAVTTLAGSAGTLGNVDGLTRFNFPFGVAVDSTRNVYWADRLNSTIFKIASGGAMAVLAGVYGQYPYGGGSADGAGPAAQFSYPRGVTVDGAGNVYVADTANSTIRKISATGVVTTFAGTAGVIGSADGSGASARFCFPTNVAADSGGNVFVVDSGNSTIRRITPGGIVTTVAGLAGAVGSADGIDAKAQFNNPTGVAVDRAGNLYIADAGNHTIRKGVLMGPPVITTQPQSQTVVPGASVQLFVTASAVPAPAYQWYFNSGVIGGATTSIFSFTNARSADAGDYTVVVTNSLGSATSAKATLTVSATQVAAAQMAAPASGGGGSVEAWFALALLAVAAVRGARRTRQA